MKTRALIAATFALPLFLMACDRSEQSPTASTPSQDRQATAPSSQDRMMDRSPPAAGTSPAPSGSTEERSGTTGSGSTPPSSNQ